MKRTLNKTWQCTAFTFALEVALPGNPKMHPVFVINKVTVVNEASILGGKLAVLQGKGSFHFAVNLMALEYALKLQLIV